MTASLVMMISVPLTLAKSTMMSARSPGAMNTVFTGTGLSSKPPSVPIIQICTPGILRLKKRAFAPSTMRNRYLRGSTFRYGQDLPFTSIMSPKNSGIQNGCTFGFGGPPLNPAPSVCWFGVTAVLHISCSVWEKQLSVCVEHFILYC